MSKVKVSQYDGTMVKVADRMVRFDKGAALPDHADSDHVKLLEERGMVVDGDPVAGLVAPSGPVAFDVEEDAKASRSRSARSGS
jgi:hypothetical protein